jgi:DNA-binding MarR family transcriptional regulator
MTQSQAPARRTRSTTAAVPATQDADSAPIISEPAVRVLRQFRQVFNSVKSHFQQMERHTGVGGAQVWALSVIQLRPGIGVNDVAKAMDVRQPTASNLVRSLAEQGCIDVRKEGPDKRAVQLYIKAAGRKLLQRTPGPFSGVLPDALAALPAATLSRLEQDLAMLIESLDTDDSATRIPLGQLLPPAAQDLTA